MPGLRWSNREPLFKPNWSFGQEVPRCDRRAAARNSGVNIQLEHRVAKDQRSAELHRQISVRLCVVRAAVDTHAAKTATFQSVVR